MDNDFDSVSWKDEHDDDGLEGITGESSTAVHDINGKRRASSGGHVDTPDDEHGDIAGFEDGVLECTVGAPLKENDGTKDAYISYLVTTHVRHPHRTILVRTWLTVDELRRPTSSPSSALISLSVDALQTFITFTNPSFNSIQRAPSHRSRISTRWNMSAATDSALTLPTAARGRCTVSSSDLPFTLFSVAPQSSLHSSSLPIGTHI